MNRILCASVIAVLVFTAARAQTSAKPRAVVFTYQRFGDEVSPATSIRLDQFDAHLDYLATAGYSVVPAADVVDALRQRQPLGERTVALTIDDCHESVFREAYPRLRERGWPFTVFVSTDPVDRGEAGCMSWDQLREMKEHGASFGNLGLGRDSLVERRAGESAAAWTSRVRAAILKAQARLQKELGESPALFAYPQGDYDPALAELVSRMGFVAFSYRSGPVGAGANLRALPRYAMTEPYAALDDFRLKAASLPLPVVRDDPWNPVTASKRPRLEVELGSGDFVHGELSCYASGQGEATVEWSEPGRRFVVQARSDFSPGRRRYNCTVPASGQRRYYWYSHPWLVLPEAPPPGPR